MSLEVVLSWAWRCALRCRANVCLCFSLQASVHVSWLPAQFTKQKYTKRKTWKTWGWTRHFILRWGERQHVFVLVPSPRADLGSVSQDWPLGSQFGGHRVIRRLESLDLLLPHTTSVLISLHNFTESRRLQHIGKGDPGAWPGVPQGRPWTRSWIHPAPVCTG